MILQMMHDGKRCIQIWCPEVKMLAPDIRLYWMSLKSRLHDTRGSARVRVASARSDVNSPLIGDTTVDTVLSSTCSFGWSERRHVTFSL